MSLPQVCDQAQQILAQVERAVVGKRHAAELVLAGILAGGHVLMEDYPGLGKTLAARSFAQALGLGFSRAQFTPDLLPSDLTGSFLYDQRNHEFTFRHGPIFTGLLLADEINRTPPKTQSALLEAQLDRFLLRVSFGYPTPQEEWEVLQRRMDRRQEAQTVGQVTDAEGLLAMQQAIETVTVDDTVGQYCVKLVDATRRHQHLLMGSSPRGSLALLLTSRAYAVVSGRDYVTPEDVKAVAHAALDHRVTVRPELWMNEITAASVIDLVLGSTTAPGAAAAVPASAFTRP